MTGRMVALACLAALLTGCLPSKPGGAVGSARACLAENPRFADAWGCIRARTAGRTDPRRDGFIEEGDILAAQVRAGKVSDADARRKLDAGLAHGDGG